MNRILAACAAFFLAVAPVATQANEISDLTGLTQKPMIIALNRTQHVTGLNPPSTWFNIQQRFVRLGFGAFVWNALCGSSTSCAGTYANLSVLPVNQLYVTVGPTTANTIGTLYQFLPDDTAAYGGYPSGIGTFLPPDATQIMLQGSLTSNLPGAGIGPLTPPSTPGQSINYLIQCQVLTQDTNAASVNIVSAGGSVSPATTPRDRVDVPSCAYVAGEPATTGTQTTPAAGTGFVAIASVAVPYGAGNITSGMIVASPSMGRFAQLSANGTIPISSLQGVLPIAQGGTGSSVQPFVDLTTNQSISGTKTYSGAIVANGGISSASALQVTSGIVASGSITANGVTDYVGYTGPSATITGPLLLQSGYALPAYTASGASVRNTNHVVIGTITASSSTATVSLTNSAAFSTIVVPTVIDVTSGNAVTSFSSLSGSSVAWPATSGHFYSYSFVGY